MPLNRRQALTKAKDMCEPAGLSKCDLTFKSFTKTEKSPAFKPVPDLLAFEGPEENPQLMQRSGDATHVVACPYLKAALQQVRKVWHCDNYVFYSSTGA